MEKKNIDLETSLQKLEPKYSYELLNDQNLDLIFESIYMGHFLLD
jgi:hypothetical protein